MISRRLVLAFTFLAVRSLKAQTNPIPQPVPYIQKFDQLIGKQSTYPEGIMGWKIASASPSNTGRLYHPIADVQLTVGGTAASILPGIYDFDGKIGLASNYNNDNSIVLALNTSNISPSRAVTVSFDAMVMRNLFDGSANDFVQVLVLAYRIGEDGPFIMLNNELVNNLNAPVNITKSNGVNEKHFSLNLPKECSNQAIVQLRWGMKTISGTAPAGRSRPNFALDNIVVE